MHRLMAFSDSEGPVPLYMEVIMRILREMAMKDSTFNYKEFKAALSREMFNPSQKQMMDIRFNLLESFLDMASINSGKQVKPNRIDVFSPQPGTLTIVDLSDPFLDASTACLLFDICLSLFEERRPQSGMTVALDEAHKFMNRSSAAELFTDHLLTTIREQRHNATRVIIATQEPAISPRLLDLCSLTLVHRFTSPDWLMTLKTHLAAASPLTAETSDHLTHLFEQIIELNTGESLLFCPTAYLDLAPSHKPQKLGLRYIRFKTRLRLGADGGKSILALRDETSSADSSDDLGGVFGHRVQ
ncbi:hypothetical protein BDV97DRAFT_352752 [Delphinella strobiligena]|nr:hypothetical protein BDV97DRAFT_352752 [Delphinella strobiligena]